MIDLSSRCLIFASHNPGKIFDLQSFFSPYNVQVQSALDHGIKDIEETGKTFQDNALLKAHAVCKQAHMPSLADDSGLCIKALNDAPGIHTKRFADMHGGVPNVFHYLEAQLNGKSTEAEFVCVLALVDPSGREEIYTGRCPGKLVFPARGESGFGYAPIFQPAGYSRTFAELEPHERHSISHRGLALEQLRLAHFA